MMMMMMMLWRASCIGSVCLVSCWTLEQKSCSSSGHSCFFLSGIWCQMWRLAAGMKPFSQASELEGLWEERTRGEKGAQRSEHIWEGSESRTDCVMGNCTKPSMKDKIKKVRPLKVRCTFFFLENFNFRINSATFMQCGFTSRRWRIPGQSLKPWSYVMLFAFVLRNKQIFEHVLRNCRF